MTESVLDQLRRRAYDEAGPLPPVELRPADAVGHVLREDVLARTDLPPHEMVAVDGWAVAGPGPWHVGSSALPHGALPDGTAVAVSAGDPLPTGASSVVPRSGPTQGEVDSGRLHAVAAFGENIRPRAAECAAGTVLVTDGTLLTAGAAALAAAGGSSDVLVTGRPTVALLVPTGPVSDPAAAATAEVLVASLVRAAGAADVAARRVPDTAIALRATIDAVHADIVVVTGSHGDERARHLGDVLTEARAEVVVDGTRDATWVAGTQGWLLTHLRDGRLLVALPAEARSAVAATLALVRPLVRGLSGYDHEPSVERTLDVAVDGDPSRSTLVAVRGAHPTRDHGPLTGHGITNADAVVLVPPHGAPEGSSLPALPF